MGSEITQSDAALVRIVHDAYSAKAKLGANDSYSRSVAEAFGYTPEQLQTIPMESNMGLSCGNPVAAAGAKEGERILDLGCGGGIDVLLAASKVGATGQAIGLDISSDMISLARRNAQRQNLHSPQVAFVQAPLTEPLPISSGSIDCILSNCVINLLPLSGKANLFKEAFRVLKPGGRIVLDDIIAKKSLPDDIRNNLALYVGCIAGAIESDIYRQLLVEAGLTDIVFVDTRGDINVYAKANGSSTTSCPQQSNPPPRPNFDSNDGSSHCEARDALLRWWDAYPPVKSSAELIDINELASLIRDVNLNKSDYSVIDVRRDDHAGGHVRNSTQCPAQTFYDDLPSFFKKFGQTSKVIFYCGSSNGRAPRCAGWYQDCLNDNGVTSSKAYVLEGGIKAWLSKFGEDADLVDED
ncbi:NAD(P)-binding protein [Russula compacta]|nr:NAD(P)-binding protein [Russula compacta]